MACRFQQRLPAAVKAGTWCQAIGYQGSSGSGYGSPSILLLRECLPTAPSQRLDGNTSIERQRLCAFDGETERAVQALAESYKYHTAIPTAIRPRGCFSQSNILLIMDAPEIDLPLINNLLNYSMNSRKNTTQV